jgi:hypothetical protein
MKRAIETFSRCALLLLFGCLPACAQDPQFLPEVDAYLRLNSIFRTYLQAKDDRDGGAPDQFAIGPSLQLYLKPLVKLKKITAFDLNDEKSRFLVLETGYRYVIAPDAPVDNRMETVATFNFPLSAGFHLADRNRADLDWKGGKFYWRYGADLFHLFLPLDPVYRGRTVLHEPV